MAELLATVRAAREADDVAALEALVPYARLMGIRVERASARSPQLRFHLPFRDDRLGSRSGGHLHGGLTAAFLEHAAIVQILWDGQSRHLPRIINFAVDYLRPGRPETLYGGVVIRRQGRRVANVHATAWQNDPDRPVAAARGHFLLTPPEGSPSP